MWAGHFWDRPIKLRPFCLFATLICQLQPWTSNIRILVWGGEYLDLWVLHPIQCFVHHRPPQVPYIRNCTSWFLSELFFPATFSVLLTVSPSPCYSVSNSYSSLTLLTSYSPLPDARIIPLPDQFLNSVLLDAAASVCQAFITLLQNLSPAFIPGIAARIVFFWTLLFLF